MSTGWLTTIWRECVRRKVARVALAYAVVGWGAVQVAATSFPHLGIPGWGVTLVIALTVLGFPAALVLAWAYDLTPDGVRADRAPAIRPDWRDVQRVLTAALELPASERPAFLERACHGEEELRREAMSLLHAHGRNSILDRAPLEFSPVSAPVALSRSTTSPRAGGYQILEKLGGGGMGVVYRARDPRLERIVALKFLPPHLSADERAKNRFLVEARSAAGLDHPNICTVHEIGETEDGRVFIAMPFYQGETLKQRIARSVLPMKEAVDVASQVARGLASAHEQGIIHRDIKPANVVLTGDGLVKIVDFGVAKLASVNITNPGATPGTLAYMSPEQARGDEVDSRTDLWSLGVVLYEMLSGERPFRGAHEGALLHMILHEEPRPFSSGSGIPLALERVVMRALAKEPESRFRTALEMCAAMEAALVAATDPPATASVRPDDPAANTGELRGVVDSAPGTDASEGSPAHMASDGERRHATIVTAALNGFAELVETMVPAEMAEVVRDLREISSEVAVRNGGVLDHLIGEEIVLLFGIPTAHEDDAARGVRAARELLERVRELSAQVQSRGAGPLRLHIGIDSGRVVASESGGGERAYRIVGAPAQLSARLAAQAGPDEVWASAECNHLVAPYFETVAEAPLAVRDRTDPVIPFRVVGESGLESRLEAGERLGLTAYTGRDDELAVLCRCLQRTGDGEGQLVTVTGEAGMGKSRLLHEFRRAGDGAASFFLGRCQSYGMGISYLPLIEILRTGLGLGADGPDASAERTVQRIREIAPELEEFAPVYLHLLSINSARHPVPKHLQGDAFRLAIQEALAEILIASARNQPVVILLEDWHWADEASHSALSGLSEVASGHSILLVVTSRPGYGVDFGDRGQHTAISLRPLERSASGEILRRFLHVDRFPAELESLLHERTGGNPFFLEEVCQALVEDGSLQVENGEARLTGLLQMLDIPDSVQAVIRARLDRLDRNARDVLRLASVIGREFTRGILDLTIADGTSLPTALDALKSAGLIQQTRVGREPVYRFKHVLTQEVAYGSLLEHQRRDLHGRVGSAIEQLHTERLDEQLNRLAHHFSRAEVWDKAVRYGVRSAARTGELAQYAEALQILERTQRWLAKLPVGSDRSDVQIQILLHQERLCETLGHRTRQQQIIDELISLLDPSRQRDQLAEAYLRQGDLFTLLRRFDEAKLALDRSLRLRGEIGDPVGERNTLRSLGLLRWHEGRNEEALDYVQQTLRIDRQRQDIPGIVGDLTNLGAILRALGEDDRALAALEEALDLSEGASGGTLAGLEDELSIKRIYALQHLANIARGRGDHTRAFEYLHRAGAIAQEKRLPIQLSYHYTSIAHVHLLQGEIEKCLHYYGEAVELTRRAKYAQGLAHSLHIRGDVLLGVQRVDEGLRDLEEAASLFAQLQDAENEALMWSKIALAREQQDDHGSAMAGWSKAAEIRRLIGDQVGQLEALEGLGRATRRELPEPSFVLSHFQHALDLSVELRDRAAEGRLRNTIGILQWERGEYALALQHFERGQELFRSLGDPVHEGLMMNSAAMALKALRRWREARERLEAAVELHRRTGERQMEGHALAALGDVCVEMDDAATAFAYYQASLVIRREIGDRRGEGWMLHNLARADLLNGRVGQASEELDQIAFIAQQCGDTELAMACEQLRRIPSY